MPPMCRQAYPVASEHTETEVVFACEHSIGTKHAMAKASEGGSLLFATAIQKRLVAFG
jgi:hypothetical protein